jgi:ligand-binding sensor domain-containing protein
MKNHYIKRNLCLLLWLLIFLNNISFAIEIQFNHGASQTNTQNLLTNSVVQYKHNQLLFGTDTGLFLHNGYDLIPFYLNSKSEENIEIYSISQMVVNKEQILWIGTNGNGLYRYDETKKQLDLFSSLNSRINSDYITALVQDENRGIWIATDIGLNYISQSLKIETTNFSNSNEINITSMIMLDKDSLLIGSLSGLFYFNTKTNTLTEIKLGSTNQDNSIYALHKDSDNNIWVGTQDAIYYKENNNNKFIPLISDKLSSKVTSISSSKDDIWVATVFEGLFKISKQRHLIDNFKPSSKKYSLSENSIKHLFNDNNNGLWISFFTNGLNYLNTKNLSFGYENVSPSSIYCTDFFDPTGFVEDKYGALWILNNKEIIEFNSIDKYCKKYTFEDVRSVFESIIIDDNGLIWVASANTIFQFEKTTKQLVQQNNNTDDLFIDFIIDYDEKSLLVATGNGLFKYFKNSKNLEKIEFLQPFTDDLVFSDYAINSENQVTFATNKGIYQFINNQLTYIKEIQNQLSTHRISNIIYDNSDNLWVVNNSYELIKFINNKIEYRKIFDGAINSIIQDDDFLWIANNTGILQLNTLTKDSLSFHQSDGLQGVYFNDNSVYQSKSGKIFFGGQNGFNAFYPTKITKNQQAPDIIFTEFIISPDTKNQKILDINNLKEIFLDYDDNLHFGISAIDYTDPIRNKYAYIMEGVDSVWTYADAKDRKIEYLQLKPGKYVLKIKGSNKDGVWNDIGKSIIVNVNPKPWFSWWAYCLYIALVILSLFWAIKWKNKIDERAKQKLVNRLLLKEVAKQTKEIKKQKQKVETL